MNNKRRKLLLGLGTSSVLAAWHKPIVKAVTMPAHAQMSPPPPPDDPGDAPPPPPPPPPPPAVCPDIVIDNVISSALSGANASTSCGVTFDILSSDPATPLQITAIDTGPLGTGVTVTNDGLGMADSTTGPRVTWQGPINGTAPGDCLADVDPTDDVTFTIEATCDGVTTPVTLTFTLSSIL